MGFVGKKIVIDACVAIDLDIPEVGCLEVVLGSLGDDQILISVENFDEIHSFRTRRLLENSGNVQVVENDADRFSVFSQELKDLRCHLGKKDKHVVCLAKEQTADYVVSSDLMVFSAAERYRRNHLLKYMFPLTTVTLLQYIFQKQSIDAYTLLDKTLTLFKYKEIDNLVATLRHQNFNAKGEKLHIILDTFTMNAKERFELYRGPLLEEFHPDKGIGLMRYGGAG